MSNALSFNNFLTLVPDTIFEPVKPAKYSYCENIPFCADSTDGFKFLV